MNSSQKKILLAVDGSDSAFKTVRYVSRISCFKNTEVVLFHVFSRIPESYWDIEDGVSLGYQIREVRAWEREQRRAVEEYMTKAKKVLWRAGFPKDCVKVKLQDLKKGIARDIVRETGNGYSCVIVGRKGLSRITNLILGSVSTKLIQRIDFAPLVVVGRSPSPTALLLALDSSENAFRIVDCVANLLGGAEIEIELMHVIRERDGMYMEAARRNIEPVFEKARNQLVSSGFESNQISTKVISGVHSRAGAILEEARKGGFGTIMVGRRGLSRVKEFLMGRVSNKVLYTAKGQAVWVIA